MSDLSLHKFFVGHSPKPDTRARKISSVFNNSSVLKFDPLTLNVLVYWLSYDHTPCNFSKIESAAKELSRLWEELVKMKNNNWRSTPCVCFKFPICCCILKPECIKGEWA